MKEFNATKYDESCIELKYSKDLQDIYNTIKDEENFILKWKEGDVCMSKVIISNSLLSKVQNSEIQIIAKEVK